MSGGWAAPCEPSAERQPQLPACSKTGGGGGGGNQRLLITQEVEPDACTVFLFLFLFPPLPFFTAFFLPDFVVVVPQKSRFKSKGKQRGNSVQLWQKIILYLVHKC